MTWGGQSRTYSAVQLSRGVNLAADFPDNPFADSFNRVDRAVAAKQAYETRQVKIETPYATDDDIMLFGRCEGCDLRGVLAAYWRKHLSWIQIPR